MITLRLAGPSQVTITGMDIENISAAQWRVQLRFLAIRLQERIAQSFGNQRIAGRVNLLKNKPSYNRWKAKHGLDTRRGHLYGELQSALDDEVLYSIRPVVGVATGSTSILFSEQTLRNTVNHAKYYEAAKVPGGRILVLAASWVRVEEAKLRAWEAAQVRRAPVRQIRQRPINVASIAKQVAAMRAALSGRARQRIAGLANAAIARAAGTGLFKRAAPQVIKSDFRFTNDLAKEAAKLLKQSK